MDKVLKSLLADILVLPTTTLLNDGTPPSEEGDAQKVPP